MVNACLMVTWFPLVTVATTPQRVVGRDWAGERDEERVGDNMSKMTRLRPSACKSACLSWRVRLVAIRCQVYTVWVAYAVTVTVSDCKSTDDTRQALRRLGFFTAAWSGTLWLRRERRESVRFLPGSTTMTERNQTSKARFPVLWKADPGTFFQCKNIEDVTGGKRNHWGWETAGVFLNIKKDNRFFLFPFFLNE